MEKLRKLVIRSFHPAGSEANRKSASELLSHRPAPNRLRLAPAKFALAYSVPSRVLAAGSAAGSAAG